MVTTNRVSPYQDYADTALGEDLLADVVYWRARGLSWEATAGKVQWNADELRRVCRHDPHFKPALALAEREYWHESQGAGMTKLREQMNDEKAHIAQNAARIVLNFMAEIDGNRTKIQMERIRAEAQIACAQAKAAGSSVEHDTEQKESDGGAPPVKLSPEQEENPIFWTAEQREKFVVNNQEAIARAAENWVAGHKEVYLWGGCHALGRQLEPDETDTSIYLSADTSIPGRVIFWGRVSQLLGRDHHNGPFLPPPGCKPAPLPVYTG